MYLSECFPAIFSCECNKFYDKFLKEPSKFSNKFVNSIDYLSLCNYDSFFFYSNNCKLVPNSIYNYKKEDLINKLEKLSNYVFYLLENKKIYNRLSYTAFNILQDVENFIYSNETNFSNPYNNTIKANNNNYKPDLHKTNINSYNNLLCSKSPYNIVNPNFLNCYNNNLYLYDDNKILLNTNSSLPCLNYKIGNAFDPNESILKYMPFKYNNSNNYTNTYNNIINQNCNSYLGINDRYNNPLNSLLINNSNNYIKVNPYYNNQYIQTFLINQKNATNNSLYESVNNNH